MQLGVKLLIFGVIAVLVQIFGILLL